MNNIFQNIFDNYIIFHLNNIFVCSKGTFENHKPKINKILNCFNKYKFYFRLKKCIFHKIKIKHLKHLTKQKEH